MSSRITDSRITDQMRPSTSPEARAAAGECLELTLRGFSPRELTARAERACKGHFGQCAWKIDEATCVPCMGSIGGRVRLYEARFVATEIPADHLPTQH